MTLIRYDLLMQLRERGTWLLLLATMLLAGFGLVEGARFDAAAGAARTGASEHERTARIDAEALAARYFRNPSDPAFAGLLWYRTPIDIRGYAFREHVGYAIKPSVPGAALAIGQADLLPGYVRVRAESMESVRTAAEIEHPGRLAAGRYDLMFFIIYLWPLILLSLCVSVLTQERESRRLRSLQLQGADALHILFAQVSGRSLASTGVLIVFCCTLALAMAAVPFSLAGWRALGAWSGIVLAYSAFWTAVALAICALSHDRMNATFAAFGAWLVCTIVLPGTLDTGVQVAAPLPNREFYIQAMRDAGDRVSADKLNSLARFYDSHPEWRPLKTSLDKVSSSVTRIQRAQELEQAMVDVEKTFADARGKRDDLYQRAMVLSPVSLTYQALSQLAGNDQSRQQRFLAEVQQHQASLRDYFQHAIQEAALADERSACAKTCLQGYGFTAFSTVPRFTPSPMLAQAPQATAQFKTMFLWIALLAAMAYWFVKRNARGNAPM